MEGIWNPWHGCHKYSEGCKNCYVYRRDTSVGRDASVVTKNGDFDLPVRTQRGGGYKVPPGSAMFCCMTSDFFIEEADAWRADIWRMMRCRSDVHFSIITKRILRFHDCIPADWGDGYPNVSFGCTVENQRRADERLPVFLDAPIRDRFIACEPLLTDIELKQYLDPARVRLLVAGGESGLEARCCRYDWILHLRDQAQAAGIGFWFKQTGARFEKDGHLYRVPRKLQHSQARKAGINF